MLQERLSSAYDLLLRRLSEPIWIFSDDSNGLKKMRKKSKFRGMFRRSASKGDILNNLTQAGPEGQLFGHKLADLCPGGTIHPVIKVR